MSIPTNSSDWQDAKKVLPQDGEWVLHTYAGVRAPEYGLFERGKFWRDDGPESFPTTHWLPIPCLALPSAINCKNPRCETTMSEGSPEYCPQCQDDREKLVAKMGETIKTLES